MLSGNGKTQTLDDETTKHMKLFAVTTVILFLYLYTVSFHKVFKVTPNWERNMSRLYIVTLLI